MADSQLPIPIKPEDIIPIIIKWHWLIIVPFCLAMIAGTYKIHTSIRVYEAKTLIFVQPQKVPSQFVQSIISTDLNARINTITQRILSRTNLEKIIKEYSLYSDQRFKELLIESKLELIRKMINVKVSSGRGRDADSFSISFKGEDPVKVRNVTNSLASFFINENLKVRESQAIGTSNFLEDELEEMRGRLEENETKLKDYREKYMGGLPEQLNSNLRILENLYTQIESLVFQIRSTKMRLDSIQNTREPTVVPASSRDDVPPDPEESALIALREQLKELQGRYTDKHPDIRHLKKRISKLESKLTLNTGKNIRGPQDGHSAPVGLSNRQRMIREIQNELGTLVAEKRKISIQIEQKKKLVEDTPKREQELMTIKRDYENIKESYNSLLSRQLEAQIAVNMERKQKGEQFRIIDPAVVPQKPVSPDIKKFVIIFLVAGLGLGTGLAFGLELLNKSVKSPEDAETLLQVPVLATIPFVASDDEKRRKILRNCLSVLGIFVAIVFLGLFLSVAVMNYVK